GRQVFPPRAATQHPQHALQAGPCVNAWAAALGTRLGRLEEVTDNRPLLVAELRAEESSVGLHPGPRATAGSIGHRGSPFGDSYDRSHSAVQLANRSSETGSNDVETIRFYFTM